MTCKHLKDMYEVCQAHQLRLSSTDLIRIVCPQCGVEEVCPSVLSDEYDEYETKHPEIGSVGKSADEKKEGG